MTDVTDLITALVAIAKDPKAWEKRIDDMKEAAGNLAEARKLKKDTDQAREDAAKDLETARYERGQAERATRDIAAQNATNQVRERDVAGKLNEVSKLMASYDEAKHKAALKLAS